MQKSVIKGPDHSNGLRRQLLWSLLSSAGFVLLLAIIQLFMFQSSAFMGMQTGGVSWEMVRLYAGIATREFLAVYLLTVLWIWPGIFFISYCLIQKKGWYLTAAAVPVLALGLGFAAVIIRYPALFEAYLSPGFLASLYRASRYLSPDLMGQAAAFLIAGCALLYLVSKSGIPQAPSCHGRSDSLWIVPSSDDPSHPSLAAARVCKRPGKT